VCVRVCVHARVWARARDSMRHRRQRPQILPVGLLVGGVHCTSDDWREESTYAASGE